MAATTCYIPLLAGQETILESYSRGHKGGIVDRTSAMWAFRYVQNLVNIRWNRMMNDVNRLQTILHHRGVQSVQMMASKIPENERNSTVLAQLSNDHASIVLKSWWNLSDYLVSKYSDGNIYSGMSEYGEGHAIPAGYPIWWLKAVGHENGPPPPISGVFMESARN